MFAGIGGERYRFEDFRENGLLLPCDERAALRTGLPLHRGPHRLYTQLVIERVGQIEAAWSGARDADRSTAAVEAHMRLDLLQRALRRYLLAGRRRQMRLNRHDPIGMGVDFTELDATVDRLWGSTCIAVGALPLFQGVQPPMPVRSSSSFFAD